MPDFNKETVLWAVDQMAGIASGLGAIHSFMVQYPVGQAGVHVKPGEEKFGRHGDIKPENILWFR